MTEHDVLAEPGVADAPPAAGPRACFIKDRRGESFETGPSRMARLWRWWRPRRRWCLGTRVVLTVCVAWLLFVVAHLLVRGRTPLWAPVELMPPILLIAVPALLLAPAAFARPIRWRVMTLMLVAGVLGAGSSGVNLAHLWYTPPPAPANAITVVSWNTEFWDQNWRAGGHGFEPDFYQHLRDLHADVYLLKEYVYIKDVEPLVPENLMAIDRLERLRDEFPGYQMAVNGEQITLSRFPIVFSRPLDMRPWLPPQLREVPAALKDYPSYLAETLRTDIQVAGQTISFYNTHTGQPPVDARIYRAATREDNNEIFIRREASFQALRADLDGNAHPAVVGADLNTSPAMAVRRLLPPQLVDHTRALSSLYPSTWLVGGYDLWHIDWVLTTPDVAVHRYEFLDPAGMSDHKVQRVVLSTMAEGT